MPPKEKSNHLSIGNLVPAHKFAPALHGGKQLDAFIEELQRPRSDWRVLPAPLEEDEQAPLAAPAFTCVVGMPTAVGVLKIASGAGGASDCTLFVRLKRSVLDAWCRVHGKDNWSRRAFSRKLDAKQATILLGAMQPHCLKEGQVHHPQALSVLCLMSLGGWLTLPNGTTRPPTECGSFTLVGLPPADPNFEQCLTLLGHRSTFKAQAAASVADSDDENTPIAHRVDPNVWGKTHGTTLCPQWVPKFQEAARVFSNQADPKVFSQHVPALNKHAPDCVRVLEKARTLFALDAKAGDEEAKAPPPPPPGRKRPPERVADSVTLAPSDPSDNEAGSDSEAEAAAPAAARPAAARPAATAGPSSSRKNGRQTQGAQKKRKGRAADEESSDEEQESMTSACSSSEEDEDDGEEDGVDADASERATSDDEDDGDAASSSSSVGAAKAPRKQKARAKKRRVEEPAPPPVSDATRMTAAEAMLAVKETALCSAMREIAAQSYEDVRAWRDGGRAPAMAEASACQVAQDLGDIQQATTPTAIVAAMSNLVKTLASAHREHFEGETCTVPTAQVTRLHAACTKATEFSQATLEEMDKAIAGLTRARELGRKALEEVASPGPSSA
jgi:hypothetical protein